MKLSFYKKSKILFKKSLNWSIEKVSSPKCPLIKYSVSVSILNSLLSCHKLELEDIDILAENFLGLVREGVI